jgi:hypothetical protein
LRLLITIISTAFMNWMLPLPSTNWGCWWQVILLTWGCNVRQSIDRWWCVLYNESAPTTVVRVPFMLRLDIMRLSKRWQLRHSAATVLLPCGLAEIIWNFFTVKFFPL